MKQTSDFELIINRPHHMPRSRKVADAGLTLLFWIVLIYLWQPMISVIAWFFKIKLFYNHMIILGGLQQLTGLIVVYTCVILLLGGTLLAWARVNQLRFRGKEKRKMMRNVTLADEAAYYDLNELNLAHWKDLKRCQVTINESDGFSAIDSTLQVSALAPGTPASSAE